MLEFPLRKTQKVGDWNPASKSGYNWTRTDAKLWNNEKGIEKIHKKWSKMPFQVDAYLVRQPGTRKTFAQGEVGTDYLRNELNLDIQPEVDAITVVYTNNLGGQTMTFTAWIMAHRLAHAIFRTDGYQEFRREIRMNFTNFLDEVYGVDRNGARQGYGEADGRRAANFQKLMLAFMQAVGTFNSARNHKVANVEEFINECMAQYIIEGEIKFGKLPRQLITRYAWGRPASGAYMKHDVRTDDIYLDDLESQLESAAGYATRAAEQALQKCLGKVFVY